MRLPGPFDIRHPVQALSRAVLAAALALVVAPSPATASAGSASNTTAGSSCTTPWGRTVGAGASVVAWERRVASREMPCTSQVRTCNAGVLSGSFRFHACFTPPGQAADDPLPGNGSGGNGLNSGGPRDGSTAGSVDPSSSPARPWWDRQSASFQRNVAMQVRVIAARNDTSSTVISLTRNPTGGNVQLSQHALVQPPTMMVGATGQSATNPNARASDTEPIWLVLTGRSDHGCGITKDTLNASSGRLFCWGRNDRGQLGVGDTQPRSSPTQIEPLQRFVRVSTGDSHTCAVSDAGVLFCWGHGGAGRLGDGQTADRLTPAVVPGAWREVAAGADHTCAIAASGGVMCWGANATGQLGLPGSGSSSPQAVPLTGAWRQVLAGAGFSCAVSASDEAWCWGRNSAGQLGHGMVSSFSTSALLVGGPGSNARWRSISVGRAHACGIRVDGSAWCWGDGLVGQIGDGGQASRSRPTAVSLQGQHRSIAAWADSACAVRTNGTMWCWGRGTNGELANGTASTETSPVVAAGGSAWSDADGRCARTVLHGGYCWGGGQHGGIGGGAQLASRTPQMVRMSSI